MFSFFSLVIVLAHPFSPHEGSWWILEPGISAGLILLTTLYFFAIGPMRRHYGWADRVDRGQVVMFLLAMIILFTSLQGPLHELSDYYSFSAHMLQHLLVTLIVPPLFISGLPTWLVDWLLQLPVVGPVMRLLTHPFAAFGLFNIVFSLWHVPAFYQAALGRPAIHSLEHILFIGTAMLTWWPIFSTATVRPRLSEPWQMLYLFAQSLIPTVLGAMITFADFALYPFYAAAPRILGLSPIDDQQIAGLLMWMGGTFIVLAVLTARFFTWMERDSDESLAASRV